MLEEDVILVAPRDECSKVLVSNIFGHGFNSRQLHLAEGYTYLGIVLFSYKEVSYERAIV